MRFRSKSRLDPLGSMSAKRMDRPSAFENLSTMKQAARNHQMAGSSLYLTLRAYLA